VVSANAAGRFSVYFCVFLARLRGANSKEGERKKGKNTAAKSYHLLSERGNTRV